jgi:hypothetical protein
LRVILDLIGLLPTPAEVGEFCTECDAIARRDFLQIGALGAAPRPAA